MMVFDQWHNGIPIAYYITSRCRQEDLTPWMHFLNESIHNIHPSWHPNAFIVDCACPKGNQLYQVKSLHFSFFLSNKLPII
jgi:hypothetical protein